MDAPGLRQLRGVVERLGLLQLDSVNVFERSHYLPAFARLGAYDKSQLDRLTFARGGDYIEYWAHEAAVIPIERWPLMRWRMAEHHDKATSDHRHWVHENRQMVDWLRAEIAEKGPLPAGAIEHDSNKSRGPWWGWSDVKRGLEVMFQWGELVSGGRTRFQRTYALPDQVLPAHIINTEVLRSDAIRSLVEHATRAHGIGTASDFADYFRLSAADTRLALQELEDEGVILPVTVDGWQRNGRAQVAWVHRDAHTPRRVETTALLSPFDPVMWRRERAERIFNFRYRIEIYTPRAQRVYGYYVLPLLIDDAIVGRVDLKSDRQNRVLRVQASWAEPGAPKETPARLATLLHETAAWQGLDGIEVMDRGNLASSVAAELNLRALPPA